MIMRFETIENIELAIDNCQDLLKESPHCLQLLQIVRQNAGLDQVEKIISSTSQDAVFLD